MTEDEVELVNRTLSPRLADYLNRDPTDWRLHWAATVWNTGLVRMGYPNQDQADHHLSEMGRLSTNERLNEKLLRNRPWPLENQ